MTALQAKVILLTGASSGIGAALAVELANRGAKLALVARSADKLHAVAANCPGSLVLPYDITEPDIPALLVEQTVNHFGHLDTLINNAGQSMLGRFDALTDLSIFERLMALNFYAVVRCTHAALPHLKASRGLVVTVSSLAGKTGVPLRTGYSASKHAVQGFMDSLRIELRDSGVDVCMISPGFVDTSIREHSLGPDGQPLGRNPMHGKRMMSAEEAARRIADAVAQRRREVLMTPRGKLLPLGRLLWPDLVDRLAKRSAEHE